MIFFIFIFDICICLGFQTSSLVQKNRNTRWPEKGLTIVYDKTK